MKARIALAALLAASPARALCPDCVASAPDVEAPLLVVLHGDAGSAKTMHDAWARFTKPRKIGLLSLACPKDEGCEGSYWRWNGDPAWIEREVEAFASEHAVDRNRLWLAGWSGGASYIGMRTTELERTFTGIVLHGGGVAPTSQDCGDANVFFLFGSANPLHGLAVDLVHHYERCKNPLQATLLPAADHAGEWKALAAHGGEILDWLEARTRPRTRPLLASRADPLACLARWYTGPITTDGGMFDVPYRTGPIVPPEDDPGRRRLEPLFDATYGDDAAKVEAALVPVQLGPLTVRIHRRAAAPLRRVAARLDAKEPVLQKTGGTFNWRTIAGTTDRSTHSWGIAIDLDPARSAYWRNDTPTRWRNQIPQAVVDAFEAEGFIWGGRWLHYDTMHFEYRPELLDPTCP